MSDFCCHHCGYRGGNFDMPDPEIHQGNACEMDEEGQYKWYDPVCPECQTFTGFGQRDNCLICSLESQSISREPTQQECDEFAELYHKISLGSPVLSGIRGWLKKYHEENDPAAFFEALDIMRTLDKYDKL